MSFWKILRVLTTNACNYKCVFCHNEGQDKFVGSNFEFLKFDDFKIIIESLSDSGLKEVQFSGGEPFMNPDTIKMIEWLNENTNLEIGCATNTQFFTDEIIQRLSKTSISLHIQFPTLDRSKFQLITKSDSYDNLIQNLLKLKSEKVSFSLNYVLLTPNISEFRNLLPFLFQNEISLKLLPYVNEKTLKHNKFEKEIFPFLDSISFKFENQNNGSLKWWLKTPQDSAITIKYINLPCFKFEFDICRNYKEIRLTPSLEIQSCLINTEDNLKLDISLKDSSKQNIKDLFEQSWKNFTHC
jgi:cyclic pyranopterin phosphate synthase|tara:strand:+ start:1283 stop:2176 length:894 start_codon:yes stop_codon:yes gene_type:complete